MAKSVSEFLLTIHNELRAHFPSLTRAAIAIYDKETDKLSTFTNSTLGEPILRLYEAQLSEVPSLQKVANSGKVRIINDLSELSDAPSEHSKAIVASGFKSSYTEPLMYKDRLYGFIFFDSTEVGFFNEDTIGILDTYSKLLIAIVVNELTTISVLSGAITTIRLIGHLRDEETANHVTRMSYYSRIIAKHLAKKYALSDEYVEYVFRFSPLHDIGKIGISDGILLKPGRLTPEEFEEMKQHTVIGANMADVMVNQFNLDILHNIDILKNIIIGHHERYDGSGYPYNIKGTDIPLEARIVALADVLDALTSERPYKLAWSFDDAFEYVVKGKNSQFDPDVIDAAVACRSEMEYVSTKFQDTGLFKSDGLRDDEKPKL